MEMAEAPSETAKGRGWGAIAMRALSPGKAPPSSVSPRVPYVREADSAMANQTFFAGGGSMRPTLILRDSGVANRTVSLFCHS